MAGDSVRNAGQDVPGQAGGFAGSDTPTPPGGFVMPFEGTVSQDFTPDRVDDSAATPPSGIGGVVDEQDLGQAGPVVLGGEDPAPRQDDQDTSDWPTLEYRSRAKAERDTRASGALDWLRRRSGRNP